MQAVSVQYRPVLTPNQFLSQTGGVTFRKFRGMFALSEMRLRPATLLRVICGLREGARKIP